MRISRQARNEKGNKLFALFSQGENEVVLAGMARWKDELKGLVVLERQCLALKEERGHLSEKQKVLTCPMENKINMQRTAPEKYREMVFEELKELGEQRTKEALELA